MSGSRMKRGRQGERFPGRGGSFLGDCRRPSSERDLERHARLAIICAVPLLPILPNVPPFLVRLFSLPLAPPSKCPEAPEIGRGNPRGGRETGRFRKCDDRQVAMFANWRGRDWRRSEAEATTPTTSFKESLRISRPPCEFSLDSIEMGRRSSRPQIDQRRPPASTASTAGGMSALILRGVSQRRRRRPGEAQNRGL